MNRKKWRSFRVAFVIFAIVASVEIYRQGGFASMGLGGLVILLLAFAAVALAIYLFVKDEPEDPDFH
jgi:hypothetical protein